MQDHLLNEAAGVARRLNNRIQLTIPSVLAVDEPFVLRIAVTGPDALPTRGVEGELSFTDSVGIEGLPSSVRLDPAAGGLLQIDGLTAVGPKGAEVHAEFEGAALASNPAWVTSDPPWRVFWGDLHIHTTYSECNQWACKSPQFAYEYAREVAHLDLAAAADHLRGIANDDARWPALQQCARDYTAPGRFVAMLALESSHAHGYGGDNNAYFLDPDVPYFWLERDDMRKAVPKVPLQTLWEFYDNVGKPYFTVPHHTGRSGKYRTFDEPPYDPAREPLFEIYSAWGSSEMRHSRFPIHGGNNDGCGYFVDALKQGCRYGLIASSDDHTTLPGGVSRNWKRPFDRPIVDGYHHMGLAAIRAPELTPAAIWGALTTRNCYATTLARTVLDLRIGDASMGQALPVSPTDSLCASRRIELRALPERWGKHTAILMRNGEELQRLQLDQDLEDGGSVVAFEDDDALDDIAIRDAMFHPEPFAVYYVRLESSQSDTQWTSPIWLDLI